MAREEQEKRQIVNQLSKYGKQIDTFDGKIDDSHLDDSNISIADPRFYTECLVLAIDDMAQNEGTQDLKPLDSTNRTRSKTWHGKRSDVHKLGRGRNLSVGTMTLRASTDDYCEEMAKREKAELEILLKSAGIPSQS